MDGERSDGALRVLTSGTSRRGALGMLAGLASFGASGLVGIRDTGAKKKRKKGWAVHGEGRPFIFAARSGDQLRIVATDVQAGAHELGALHLQCASGGDARKLSDGFPRTQQFPEPAGAFFDETFTI